jgi:L-2-hydroxyglutarate oxidase
MHSTIVIGGGLVGLATAWKLLERFPGSRVSVLEKEGHVGAHQSTHNSGVLHCGLYYQPGSQKARLAVQGIREMVAFCREEDIPHEVCGKLVVATREEELPRLDELMRRGAANGLEGLQRLGPDEMRRIEPHVAGIAAARVPQEGIVDYRAVCDRLAARVQERGGVIHLNSRVRQLQRHGSDWVAATSSGEHKAEWLVNCAGLHCDRVAALAGEKREVRIVPFRGEYYKLRADRADLVRHLIYPVPDPKFPFLGVHFTRLIEGGVEAGPNAVLAFAREGYTLTKINPADLWDALSFSGLWRFLGKYPAMVRTELAQSISKTRFCRALQRLVPDLRPEDLAPGGAGVRAQAMSPEGSLVQDFHILQRDHALHVLNAPSPAATASLAIGNHIAGLLPD